MNMGQKKMDFKEFINDAKIKIDSIINCGRLSNLETIKDVNDRKDLEIYTDILSN